MMVASEIVRVSLRMRVISHRIQGCVANSHGSGGCVEVILGKADELIGFSVDLSPSHQ